MNTHSLSPPQVTGSPLETQGLYRRLVPTAGRVALNLCALAYLVSQGNAGLSGLSWGAMGSPTCPSFSATVARGILVLQSAIKLAPLPRREGGLLTTEGSHESCKFESSSDHRRRLSHHSLTLTKQVEPSIGGKSSNGLQGVTWKLTCHHQRGRLQPSSLCASLRPTTDTYLTHLSSFSSTRSS